MDSFTEAYRKARDVVAQQKFSADWNAWLKDRIGLHRLLGEAGFERGHAPVPEALRQKVAEACVPQRITAGDVLYNAAANAQSAGRLEDRAAALKFVKHVYLANQAGGQSVWVYAPPASDAGWVFDEIAGQADTVKARLCREDEIFSAEERAWMTASLAVSRKIVEDCKVKLAGGVPGNMAPDAVAAVRKWFLDVGCGDGELREAAGALNAGFKKIAAACNAATLVFADYPDWRAQRDKYFGAAFRGGEGGGFPVIYLEGAFTRMTGNSGKQWLCAETIIHEMSHHEVSTEDHRYDHHGLKPTQGSFPFAKAIENADSWGYFAIDLAGYLSVTDNAAVYK